MERCSTKSGFLWYFWVLGAVLLQSCSPLSGANNLSSSCLVGIFSNNQQVPLTQSGVTLPGGGIVSVTTIGLAESFLASATASITKAGANLDAVVPSGSSFTSSVVAAIEADSSSGSTPTGPNGTPLGSTTISGSLIPLKTSGAQFVTIDFSSTPISVTAGQVYWLILAGNYATTSTSYVEWAASTSTFPGSIADYFSTSWLAFGTGVNFDFKIGC